MLLFEQMSVFFIIMLIGYFLAQKNIWDEKTVDSISWAVVNICSPALIISGAVGEKMEMQTVIESMKIAVGVYLVLLVLGIVMPYILRDKENKSYTIMTVFGNIGFMGFPLIEAMYGKSALIVVTIFNVIYNILMYTYGIIVISGKKFEKADLRKFINPGIIACIVQFMIYFNDFSMPDFGVRCLTMISNMTAPLSMMVIGASVVGLSVMKLFTDFRLVLFSLFRMIIIPMIFYFILSIFIKDQMILGICLVMLSVPVGSMTVIVARQYKGDYETASRGVAITTLLSVMTMPLLFGVLQ